MFCIAALSLVALSSEDNNCQRNKWNNHKRVGADFFPGEPSVNMNAVAQSGCRDHRSNHDGEHVFETRIKLVQDIDGPLPNAPLIPPDFSRSLGIFVFAVPHISGAASAQFGQDATIAALRNPNFTTTISNRPRQWGQRSSDCCSMMVIESPATRSRTFSYLNLL
jgi:hypothetical protein